ncbi:MAG: MaoC family protein [Myxococcales bacterium]|nr:MAG: MaoC family protein [Myxococcales bacterium]
MAIDLTAVGTRSAPRVFSYDDRAPLLYALGIGARRGELPYLYEGNGPRVYPTFGVIPTVDVVFDCLQRTGCDLAMIVHHAQELSMPAPLPPAGVLTTVGEVEAIHDMKKLAQVVVATTSRDASGAIVTSSRWTILVRGAGNFGGSPPPKKADEAPVPRDRPADFRVEETTSPEQALLYRLSGDRNPLHADPVMAAGVGFPQGPILHGLCTLGYAARALIGAGLGGDGDRLVKMGAQFRRPVWPGDTLVTEGWWLDEGRVALQTSVAGRPDPVLTAAWAVTTPAAPHDKVG